MNGIGAAYPRGTGWEYSLDGLNWQTSNIFLNLPNGASFVKGVTYTILCRNLTFELATASMIVYGRATNEDGLDEVAKRSGLTTALVKLFGGLFLANLRTTNRTDLAHLVIDETGEVFLLGGTSINLEPTTTVVLQSIWEEKPERLVVRTPNNEWTGTTDNPLPTVNAIEPDHLITGSGTQYYELRPDLFADPGDTLTLAGKRWDGSSTYPLPFGITLSYDTASGKWRISVLASVADQNFLVWLVALDSLEQASLPTLHRLTINRAMTPIEVERPSLTSWDEIGPYFMDEDGHPNIQYPIISGTWSWNSVDQLVQTNLSTSQLTRMLCTVNGSQNGLDSVQSIAKVKAKALVSANSYIGVGIRYAIDGTAGYCLVLQNSTTLQLFQDGLAIGPAVTIPAVAIGTPHYFKIRYEETGTNTAKISGKIWNVLQAEPDAWQLVWENRSRISGYPALLGGSNGASGAFGYWDQSKNF